MRGRPHHPHGSLAFPGIGPDVRGGGPLGDREDPHARPPLATILSSVFAALALNAATAGVIHVDRDAVGGTDNGTSWENAYLTLTDAIAAAASGDEIWVAEGVYRPNDASGTKDRTQWFQLKNGVAVYGGFQGTENKRDARDPIAHPTILSGDIEDDDADTDHDGFPEVATMIDNCYHVVYHPGGLGLDASARLDGFTIRGGNADGASPHCDGGGIYNAYCSPTIARCTISANAASSNGGGVFNYESAPGVADCALSGNAADWGGAVANHAHSAPALTGCALSGNKASGGGGVLNDASSPSVIDCTISGNSAANGGGMANYYASSPIITRCTLSGNSAVSGGGGILDHSSASTLIDCTLSDNTAVGGAGMFNQASSPTLTGCTLSGNSASADGGAVYNYLASSPELTNCTVSGNTAVANGGGILNWSSSPALIHCTISSNSAAAAAGVYNYQSSSPPIANCILWGNSPGPQIFNYEAGSAPIVDHCVIEGGYATGSDIFTDDPLLAALGDHGGPTPTQSIGCGSSAIGKGLTGPQMPANDQRGFARDTAPDIGACEFQEATLLGTTPGAPAAIGSWLDVQVHTDHSEPAWQWYIGSSGDTSHPIAGATQPTLSHGPLELGVSVWVRVTPGGGAGSPADSAARTFEIRGTYEQWCDFHALTGEDHEAAACPARDGICNLLKFALALDPALPCTLDARCRSAYDPGAQVLKQTWTLSKTPTDVEWNGQSSGDLVEWLDGAGGPTRTLLESDAGTETWELSVPTDAAARGFLRLQVSRSTDP